MQPILQVLDRLVPYDGLINDIVAHIVYALKKDFHDPEFISQRRAFKIFGRANVERWRKLGLVNIYKRPGKIEYRTAELRLLQRTSQDYLNKCPVGKQTIYKGFSEETSKADASDEKQDSFKSDKSDKSRKLDKAGKSAASCKPGKTCQSGKSKKPADPDEME